MGKVTLVSLSTLKMYGSREMVKNSTVFSSIVTEVSTGSVDMIRVYLIQTVISTRKVYPKVPMSL